MFVPKWRKSFPRAERAGMENLWDNRWVSIGNEEKREMSLEEQGTPETGGVLI
jgi:hypothetical protein